jgi:hypothetical protein
MPSPTNTGDGGLVSLAHLRQLVGRLPFIVRQVVAGNIVVGGNRLARAGLINAAEHPDGSAVGFRAEVKPKRAGESLQLAPAFFNICGVQRLQGSRRGFRTAAGPGWIARLELRGPAERVEGTSHSDNARIHSVERKFARNLPNVTPQLLFQDEHFAVHFGSGKSPDHVEFATDHGAAGTAQGNRQVGKFLPGLRFRIEGMGACRKIFLDPVAFGSGPISSARNDQLPADDSGRIIGPRFGHRSGNGPMQSAGSEHVYRC